MNGSNTGVSLAICCKDSSKLIGYAGIAKISHINRSGEYFILIGETDYWEKGIGTEATILITEYGFSTLGLHRIFLTVSEFNKGALRAYEKAGYTHEGLLRDAAFRDGRFHNKILMSALSNEWKAV